MLFFFLRRLLVLPPLLLVISLLTYLLLQAAPGDYFSQLEADPKNSQDFVMGLRASVGKAVEIAPAERGRTPGAFRVGSDDYGFDAAGRLTKNGAPAVAGEEQLRVKRFRTADGTRYTVTNTGRVFRWSGTFESYFVWLENVVVKRDLGKSFKGEEPVSEVISQRVINTLILEAVALAMACLIAIPLGVWSGVRPNSGVDHACGFISYVSLSIPTVFLSILALLFAYSTKWFPVGDMSDVRSGDFSAWRKFTDVAWHVALPATVIALAQIAIFMRQMRSQMVETMSTDYVRTARAKGLSPNRVMFKHALRNAINPLVTLFGYSLAALLSGSFLVEVVFNWPGLAQVTVNSIFQKDEPLVMACVLMATLILVVGNLVADVLLALVDPRIRLE